MEELFTNALINSTSPYLLQHAHNPVNWQPWSEEIIQQAKKENKLLLVSIGYAACHWCHVMEHESFEDKHVADVMNRHFVCIKVDREERPDIDHYYMTAVQLMSRQGGWPLNVIALPDGRPIWGGTYFPKETWLSNLLAIAQYYIENQEETERYADDLQKGIQQVSLIEENESFPVSELSLEEVVSRWKKSFDYEYGGRGGAPKFPMPVNLEFLLNYGYLNNDKSILDYVKTTLERMARGGINDQIGGGFARYSVDEHWKVPHFEKMLYDNGQLLSIYSKGFQLFKKEEFKDVVYETVSFLERELMDESGAFYSSLDADSDGEEGRFYIWNRNELNEILGSDSDLFADFYNVNENGWWEGSYILLRNTDVEDFAQKKGLTLADFQEKVNKWKQQLLEIRSKRNSPGLDDKTLASWNALVINGLMDAFKAFNNSWFLDLALKNAHFLVTEMLSVDGKLLHTWKKGIASVNGFLEDYALVINAFISLFEVTGDSFWLDKVKVLFQYAQNSFYDKEKGLYYFSEKQSTSAIINHFQTEDNVIPAANSVMATNIYKLGLLWGEPKLLKLSQTMSEQFIEQFRNYPMAFANWGTLLLKRISPSYEVAISGNDAKQVCSAFWEAYHPNILFAFSDSESDLSLLKSRFVKGKTLIYVCEEGICQLPVNNVDEARKMIKKQI